MSTNSIFKILPSELWEEAKLTGVIPRVEIDNHDDCVHVCEFEELTQVCAKLFQPNEYPVALEFSPDSYGNQLQWRESTKNMPWRDGQIKVNNLLADLVLNIYSFELEQTNSGSVFRLQGE